MKTKTSFLQLSGFLLLLLCISLISVSLVYLFFSTGEATAINLQSKSVLPTPTLPPTAKTEQGTASPQAQKPCAPKQRDFQMGVSFPQWTTNAYSGSDTKWFTELPEMRAQTAACWVEMPILFSQSSSTSTDVTTSLGTPSVQSFIYGIQYAHALKLHIFVTVLVQSESSPAWAGSIHLSTHAQQQEWFDNYWQTLKPYAIAAAQANVEQLTVATEEEWLQENASDASWNGLIANVRSVFSGTLTYNMNWTSLDKAPRSWFHNADLKMIGISAYLPLIDTSKHIETNQIATLWATAVKQKIDAFALKIGAPIFISEIGYRNSADALYQPWVSTSSAPADPDEQAAACSAALTNILSDPNILGVFFWGWDDVGAFTLKDSQAASVIQKYYTSLQA